MNSDHIHHNTAWTVVWFLDTTYVHSAHTCRQGLSLWVQWTTHEGHSLSDGYTKYSSAPTVVCSCYSAERNTKREYPVLKLTARGLEQLSLTSVKGSYPHKPYSQQRRLSYTEAESESCETTHNTFTFKRLVALTLTDLVSGRLRGLRTWPNVCRRTTEQASMSVGVGVWAWEGESLKTERLASRRSVAFAPPDATETF